jgi:hypothetical protein
MARFQQGYYKIKHKEKYLGDPAKVRYMSSWELSFFNFLDNNPNVIQWSSEEIPINYIKPTDGKVHKYFPDVFMCYKNKRGEIKWELIEIKPKQQTRAPKRTSKHRLYEQLTYAVNVAKWKAAQQWCINQTQLTGKTITFKIITEQQLFA